MLNAYARIFISLMNGLQAVRYGFLSVMGDQDGFTEEESERLKKILRFLSQSCGSVDLAATKHLADELLEDVKPGANADELDAKIDSIQSMAKNELAERKFFYVPQDRTGYYDNKTLCGAAVAEKFPDALPEIIEAGNCYALARPTACVFHLMRVIPYGMAAFAGLLKVKYSQPIKCLEWLAIIQPIEKQIRAIQQLAKTPRKMQDIKDFSEIAQHLHFCKDAWRNHVSHSIDRYDMPQAKSVMNHVELVMQLVSKRLKKPFTGLR